MHTHTNTLTCTHAHARTCTHTHTQTDTHLRRFIQHTHVKGAACKQRVAHAQACHCHNTHAGHCCLQGCCRSAGMGEACATKGVGTQRGVHLKWKTFVCVCVAVCVVVAREAPPRAWVDMQRGVHLKCGMCVCVVYVHAFATVFGCLCTWMLVCICLRVCALPQRFGAFA